MKLTPEELERIMKANPELSIAGQQLVVEGLKLPKQHKYHVAPKEERTFNGKVYHSKKEAEFAQELFLRQKARNIDFWLEQVPFSLPGDTVYRLDFMTFQHEVIGEELLWEIMFVEVKGYRTRLGEIKRKQCEQLYGISIEVV